MVVSAKAPEEQARMSPELDEHIDDFLDEQIAGLERTLGVSIAVTDLDGRVLLGGRTGGDVHATCRLRHPLQVNGAQVGWFCCAAPSGVDPRLAEMIARWTARHLDDRHTIVDCAEAIAREWKTINALTRMQRDLVLKQNEGEIWATVTSTMAQVLSARWVWLANAAGTSWFSTGPECARLDSTGLPEPVRAAIPAGGKIVRLTWDHPLPGGGAASGDSSQVLACAIPNPTTPDAAIGHLVLAPPLPFRGPESEYRRILGAMALSLGTAVEAGQLAEAQRREAELRQELKLAGEIQRQMRPTIATRIGGVEVDARCLPAMDIGGDYYDVLFTQGRTMFVIADVSGHGIGSALFMSNVRSILRAQLHLTTDLTAIAVATNEIVCADAGKSGMFVSLVIARVDPEGQKIEIVNMGHPAPILWRRGEERPVAMAEGWLPAGVLASERPQALTLPFGPGDLCLLYTDGMIEARREDGQMFGLERLETEVRRRRHDKPAALVDGLLAELDRWAGSRAYADDRTLVAFRVQEGGKPAEPVTRS